MPRKNLDLIVVGALAALALTTALLGVDFLPIRAPLGLLLVLVLPGYALTAALFATHPLHIAEQVVATLGLSLALTILAGPVLDVTPWGLQPDSWAVILSLMTLVADAVAYRRRRNQAPQAPTTNLRFPALSLPQVLVFGLAAAIVVGALGMARAGALDAPTPGFTQLWLVPQGTTTPQQLQVGVSNQEDAALQYKVQIIVNGSVAQEWPALALEPGKQWTTTVTLPANLLQTQPVAALLYRVDAPQTVYRRVDWWPGGQQPDAAGQPTPTLPDLWPTVPPPPGAPPPTAVSGTPVASATVTASPTLRAPESVATPITPTGPPPAPTVAATNTATGGAGPGSSGSAATPTPVPSLHIGATAWATGLDGSVVRVRSAPGLNASQIGSLGSGTIVVIVAGPQQADRILWWQIIGWNSTAQPGWIAGNYLQPLPCCPSNAGGH